VELPLSVTICTTGARHARCVAIAETLVLLVFRGQNPNYIYILGVYGAAICGYERNEFVEGPEGNLSNNYDDKHSRFSHAAAKSNSSQLKKLHSDPVRWLCHYRVYHISEFVRRELSLTSHPVLSNIRVMTVFRTAPRL
jgi:hypothetical protein